MLMAAATFIQAQEGRGNGRLAGTVMDEKGDAIEGATVTLKYIEYDHKLQTKSNKKGLWGSSRPGQGGGPGHRRDGGYASSTTQQPVSGVSPNPDIRLVLKKGTGAAGDENRDAILRANDMFDNRQYEEALKLYQEFAQKNPTNLQGRYLHRQLQDRNARV